MANQFIKLALTLTETIGKYFSTKLLKFIMTKI